MSTAILVDGAFFLKRYERTYGRGHSARTTADDLFSMCIRHLCQKDGKRERERELYRIFFYDCPPLQKKAHNPITQQAIDFADRPSAEFRRQLHDELRRKRKVALRLGYLADRQARWVIKPEKTRELLARRITLDDLGPADVTYEVRQKGVDMRIGLDIASMAYKRLVDQIVLVAGDSDFVPAAKLARREGIDFLLDPMWQQVRDDLFEHIDGLRSVCPKPGKAHTVAKEMAETASVPEACDEELSE